MSEIADLVAAIRAERKALVIRPCRELGYALGYDAALQWVLATLDDLREFDGSGG